MEVVYKGDLLAPSGYSRAIRAHMRALIESGVKVLGEHSPHDKTALDFSKHPFWGERMPEVLQRGRSAPIRICHETPEFYEPDPTRYNIGYVVWETSRIIDYDIGGNPRCNWVKQMNLMDEIWTSAEFCKKAFRDSGVIVPIHVFPHPIDLDTYTPGGSRPTFMAGNRGLDQMVFLSVFQFTKRKNPQDLLIAWTTEFANQTDVSLVIKTYASDFKDNSKLREYILGLRNSCRMRALAQNVHLILDLIPDEDMPELYRMSDVFVLPSFGEGFGMPYQEAMACGVPVIYTDASSMPEFCVGWPVKCDPEPVYGMLNIPWYSASQNWWKVRVPDLRRALREAYDAWKYRAQANSAFSNYQAFARAKVEELHSHAVVGEAMRERLEKVAALVQHGSIRPELAVWGSVPSLRELRHPPADTI